jgi:hypothetical protein
VEILRDVAAHQSRRRGVPRISGPNGMAGPGASAAGCDAGDWIPERQDGGLGCLDDALISIGYERSGRSWSAYSPTSC